MRELNAHQQMVQSIKVFAATASDTQLAEKKELLLGLISSADNEIAKAGVKCLRLIENEIADRQ